MNGAKLDRYDPSEPDEKMMVSIPRLVVDAVTLMQGMSSSSVSDHQLVDGRGHCTLLIGRPPYADHSQTGSRLEMYERQDEHDRNCWIDPVLFV